MSLSNLFRQREKFNQPKTRNPATPAERAEAAWDERIGGARVAAYNWRRIALGLIVCCIALTIGLVVQSLKSTVIPYVVTVDKQTGEVEKAGAFTNSNYTPQEGEIKYFIAEFVKNARTIGYDPVAYSNMQRKAGHFLTVTAAQKYATTMKNDQNKKLGKYTVSVKNISVQKVPESDSSYLVRWVEEVVRINSSEYQDIPMSGTFSYTKLPVKEEDLLINPLGLYITGFDFVQDAAAVNAGGAKSITGAGTGSASNANKNNQPIAADTANTAGVAK